MGTRFFSTKDRAPHLGQYPLERLLRSKSDGNFTTVPPMEPLSFTDLNTPHSLVNAMGDYQAMMDAVRDGLINRENADIPVDPIERANHVQSFGYFSDASMMGI